MRYSYGYFDPFSFFAHIIVWVVIVWVILAILRRLTWGHGRRMGMWHDFQPKDPGMDILRERYAKGEITKEEFESKKKDLSS